MSGPIKNVQTVIFLVTLKANIVAYFLISASNSEEVAEYKLVRDVDPKSNDVQKTINYGGSVDIIKTILDHSTDLDHICFAWDGSLIPKLCQTLDIHTPDFVNIFSRSYENFHLGVLYKVCVASFRELLQRNIFFPYFYFLVRVRDYLDELSAPPLPCGGLLNWEDVRESLTQEELEEAYARDRYEKEWAPFENVEPKTKAKLMNDFVICAVTDRMTDTDRPLWKAFNSIDYCMKQMLEEMGIDVFEIQPGGHVGTLTELTASKLCKKPFQLKRTHHSEEHLTLDDASEFPCIRVLDVATLSRFYPAHATGATRVANIPSYFRELIFSHLLFFSRDSESRKIGRQLLVDDAYMDELLEYSKTRKLRSRPHLNLQSYPIYGGRLRTIFHTMNAWRPHTFKHLTIKPYHDPLSYYAFWFAVMFGVIGLLGLTVTIAQTYATFKELNSQNQAG